MESCLLRQQRRRCRWRQNRSCFSFRVFDCCETSYGLLHSVDLSDGSLEASHAEGAGACGSTGLSVHGAQGNVGEADGECAWGCGANALPCAVGAADHQHQHDVAALLGKMVRNGREDMEFGNSLKDVKQPRSYKEWKLFPLEL